MIKYSIQSGILWKDGSGVAIDWVTGQPYSHEKDGSIHSQHCSHCGKKASVRALQPVIVGTEKVLRGAGGPMSGCIHSRIPRQGGGKAVAPKCGRSSRNEETILEIESVKTISYMED